MEIVSVQESKSKLTFPPCLIWETERPYENKVRQSPHFTFNNREWYLKLQLGRDFIRQTCFDLFVVPTDERKDFPAFTVNVYFKKGSSNVFYQCRTAHSSNHYNISSILMNYFTEKINCFDLHGIFRIVCVLDDADNYTRLCGSQDLQSVHFLKTKSPLSSTKSTQCPSSIPENKTSSLENLSKDLEALLDSETLPDVQLMVEETSIPCHRAVLVARSKVFAAMFQHEMTESTSGVLEVKDMDLSTIKVLLKYLYSGKIPVDLTEEELINLFKSADKYQVHALKKECSRKIIKNITEENCLSYLSLADTHNDQEFKEAVVWFIVRDNRIIKSSEWSHFSAENPILAIEIYRRYVETVE